MSEYPRMLYRSGGSEDIHGHKLATRIVINEEELSQALNDGWHVTTTAAVAPAADAPDSSPPTRAEMEQKAAELGIKVDGRWGDAKLMAAIEQAMSGGVM